MCFPFYYCKRHFIVANDTGENRHITYPYSCPKVCFIILFFCYVKKMITFAAEVYYIVL